MKANRLIQFFLILLLMPAISILAAEAKDPEKALAAKVERLAEERLKIWEKVQAHDELESKYHAKSFRLAEALFNYSSHIRETKPLKAVVKLVEAAKALDIGKEEASIEVPGENLVFAARLWEWAAQDILKMGSLSEDKEHALRRIFPLMSGPSSAERFAALCFLNAEHTWELYLVQYYAPLFLPSLQLADAPDSDRLPAKEWVGEKRIEVNLAATECFQTVAQSTTDGLVKAEALLSAGRIAVFLEKKSVPGMKVTASGLLTEAFEAAKIVYDKTQSIKDHRAFKAKWTLAVIELERGRLIGNREFLTSALKYAMQAKNDHESTYLNKHGLSKPDLIRAIREQIRACED